jgi:hypothetical protein
MSIEAMASVLHHSRARSTAKLVLLGIANHAGDGGAWPTVATLATYANTNERSVQRALAELVELGEVSRALQAGGTARSHKRPNDRPNLYVVLVECPAGCAGGSNHRAREGWKRLEDGTYLPVDTGVTPVSPGDASVTPGVTPVSPLGVTPVSPEPSYEPPSEPSGLGPALATDRVIRCDVCHHPEGLCRFRQERNRPEDRHEFTPPAFLVVDSERSDESAAELEGDS